MTIAWLNSVIDASFNTALFFRCWRQVAVVLLALAAVAPGYAQQRYNDNDAGDPRSGAPRHYDERGPQDRNNDYRRGNQGAVVRCESKGQDYRHCRADTRDGVQLYRQLSKNACRYNESWGYDRRGVWVDQGCRGDFQLYTGRSGGDGRNKDDHTAAIVGGAVALGVLGAALSEKDKDHNEDRPRRLVRCESDGDYRHCRADFRNGVRLHRQLSRSSCRQNESWGYDRRGVWVDRGCRAEFSLN